MTRKLGKLIVTAVLVAGLTACGGGGGNNDTSTPTPPPVGVTPPPTTTPPPPGPGTPPPPATPSTIAARFGAAFAAIFGANRNSEPKDPAATDLAGVNRTAEAIDITN